MTVTPGSGFCGTRRLYGCGAMFVTPTQRRSTAHESVHRHEARTRLLRRLETGGGTPARGAFLLRRVGALARRSEVVTRRKIHLPYVPGREVGQAGCVSDVRDGAGTQPGVEACCEA